MAVLSAWKGDLLPYVREEKARIARSAVGLVENGDSIFLDFGSTVCAVAQELRNEGAGEKSQCTWYIGIARLFAVERLQSEIDPALAAFQLLQKLTHSIYDLLNIRQ